MLAKNEQFSRGNTQTSSSVRDISVTSHMYSLPSELCSQQRTSLWASCSGSRPAVVITPRASCSSTTNNKLRRSHDASKALPRRAVVVGAGGLLTAVAVGAGVLSVTAMAASAAANNPQALVRSGMKKFRQNDVEGSLRDFDAAYAADERMRPYLWQRGLSLYYVGDYKEGSRQFRMDVAVNPNDTEESIWAFLCEARTASAAAGKGPDGSKEGAAAARRDFLEVGRDPRPVMRAAYQCFKTGAQPGAILEAARGDREGHDAFYANLYVGLWHEAEGDAEAARAAITAAVQTQYARGSGDYMADLARVHVQRRGWA